MAVDIDAALVVTKKGTEAIGQTATEFENLDKKAKAAGETLSWTGEQVKKATDAMRSGFAGGATSAMLKDLEGIAKAGLSGAAAITSLGQLTEQRFAAASKASSALKTALAAVPPELMAMDRALQVAASDNAKFTSSVERLTKELTGKNLKQEMGALAVAIEKVGGASKITAPEFDKLQEKIAKYKAAGLNLPSNLAGLEMQGPQLPKGWKPPSEDAGGSSSMMAGFAGGAAVAGIQAATQLLTSALRLAKDAAVALFETLVAGFQAAVVAAMEFEKTMTQVKVLSNSSADDMRLYNEEIMKMGAAVGSGPQVLAEGLLRVTSLGKTGAEALDILKQSAQLSAVGLGEVGTIATAITGAVNAYGAANLSASQAADILTAVVREGGAEANAYAGTLGRIAPLAANLGIRFADLGANLAAFTRLGVSASEATTGMSSFMAALLKPTDDGILALKMFGGTALDTMAKVKAAMKDEGLAQTMVKLMAAFKGHDDALAALLPNVRALRDAMATAGSQGEEYIAIQDRIRNSLGDAQKAFDETAKTASFQFDSIKASVETAALKIGLSLLPAATKFLEFAKAELVPLLGNLIKLFEENSETITKSMVSALTKLKDAASGTSEVLANLRATIEYFSGDPIDKFVSKLSAAALALLNMTSAGRAMISAISDAAAIGGAVTDVGKRKREADEAAAKAAAHNQALFSGIGMESQDGGPGAGILGPSSTPEQIAANAALAASVRKLADENTHVGATFDELKTKHQEAAAESKKHEKAIADLIKEMHGLGSGKKDVEAIEEALAEGGGAASASAEFVKKFGKQLSEAAAAGVPLTEEGQKLVSLYTEQLNATQLNKDLDKAALAADKAFKASEKAIDGIVAEMKGLGTGKSNVESIEAALARIGPEGIQSAEATKKFGTELLAAAAAGVTLTEAGEEAVAAWLRMKDANATIAEQKHLIQGLGPSVQQLAVKYAALAAAIRAQQASPEGLNKSQKIEAIQQLEQMRAIIVAAGGDVTKLDAQLKELGSSSGLDRVRGTFAEIAQLAAHIGSSMGGWKGAAVSALGNASQAVANYGTAKTGQQKAAAGVAAAGTAFDIYEQNKHELSAGKATMSGASQGAAAGAAFGPYGVIIGAVVGGVIGFFSGSKFRELAKSASKELGFQVSKELAESIEKTMKTLKLKDVKSAVLLNLDQAITESGKAASTFAPQINDLIKGIADKSIPAKQGMEQLSKSFSLLAAEAAKSKVASQAMFSVMKQARESKVMTDEMTQAIKDAIQAMAAAVPIAFGALNDGKATGGLKIMSDESAAAQATIFAMIWGQTVAEVGLKEAARLLGPGFEALQAKLADSGFGEAAAAIFAPIQQQFELATNEMFANASDAATGFADILKNAINTAMPLTIEQLNAFGQVAQDSFEQARDAALDMGLSTEEATRQALIAIAPLLQQLEAASKAYGVPLSENNRLLIEQAKAAGIAFAEDPMVKAADAMERVADALEKVFHLTTETTKGFNNMGDAANNVRPPKPNNGGGGEPPPPYASGGIFRGPLSGGLAMLHGNEAVMTLPQLYGEMAAIISNATAELLSNNPPSGGSGSMVYSPTTNVGEVHFHIDGGAADGGLDEAGRKWKRMLETNAAESATTLDARIDRRIKARVG